jgi:ribonuclease P/MRP protein subunit POP5
MKKIKPILPSLRERKRYLAFEIMSKDKLDSFPSVSKAIWQSALRYLGEKNTAKAGIWLLADKYKENAQKGLIKVGHKYVNDLKASLALMKQIEGKEVIVRSLGVSGILNKAEKYTAK